MELRISINVLLGGLRIGIRHYNKYQEKASAEGEFSCMVWTMLQGNYVGLVSSGFYVTLRINLFIFKRKSIFIIGSVIYSIKPTNKCNTRPNRWKIMHRIKIIWEIRYPTGITLRSRKCICVNFKRIPQKVIVN